MGKIERFKKDRLKIKISKNRKEMGEMAAKEAARKIRQLLDQQSEVNMIFAAAPSQNEFLSALIKEEGIDWSRINAFHMDEYIGLPKDHPQNFANFLRKSIFEKVPFHKVYYIQGNEKDIEKEMDRYEELLSAFPVDIVCMGIGENTHIAFNDPGEADFNDPKLIKKVELDDVSRQQQVHDGCFPAFEHVPASALSLTVPALLQGKHLFCIVPGPTKAEAVFQTINEEISEKFPSTSLRNHPDATLYLDKDSAAKLNYLKEEKVKVE